MKIGIRELEAHLSEYVRKAAAGEQVLVTDRGRPIARLEGLGGASMVEEGIAEGWTTPPARSGLTAAVYSEASLCTMDVVDEDHGRRLYVDSTALTNRCRTGTRMASGGVCQGATRGS